jgi:hypothetical protein
MWRTCLSILWKEICNFRLFVLKSVMSVDTNALCRSDAKVANLSPEEDLTAESSPIRHCLTGPSFNLTAAAAI